MFFKKKKKEKEENNPKQTFKIFTAEDYDNIAQDAVEYAKAFDKNFDYSDDSIDAMQEIMESARLHARHIKTSERSLWNMSTAFGIYLGQTILKNHLAAKGYAWRQGENGIPVVENDKGTNLSPITKIFKHLTQDYEEDIRGFYNTSIILNLLAQALSEEYNEKLCTAD